MEESNLHTDLHRCHHRRISIATGCHRQPLASRAGAEKSSQALYQPCTDVGVTAPDESAMADTEIRQPQLTQRVALMGWGDIGWLMVESMEGGGDSGNQNPFDQRGGPDAPDETADRLAVCLEGYLKASLISCQACAGVWLVLWISARCYIFVVRESLTLHCWRTIQSSSLHSVKSACK